MKTGAALLVALGLVLGSVLYWAAFEPKSDRSSNDSRDAGAKSKKAIPSIDPKPVIQASPPTRATSEPQPIENDTVPSDDDVFTLPEGNDGWFFADAVRRIKDGHFERMFDDRDLLLFLNPTDRPLSREARAAIAQRYRQELETLVTLGDDVQASRKASLQRKVDAGITEPLETISPDDPRWIPGSDHMETAPRTAPGEYWNMLTVGKELRFVRLRPGEDPHLDNLVAQQKRSVESIFSRIRRDIAAERE